MLPRLARTVVGTVLTTAYDRAVCRPLTAVICAANLEDLDLDARADSFCAFVDALRAAGRLPELPIVLPEVDT